MDKKLILVLAIALTSASAVSADSTRSASQSVEPTRCALMLSMSPFTLLAASRIASCIAASCASSCDLRKFFLSCVEVPISINVSSARV